MKSSVTASFSFGTKVTGAEYVFRPSGYAIIEDDHGRIAAAWTPKGLFLLGGGQDKGESLEATVAREAMEECGLEVCVQGYLGTAAEYLYAADEKTYYYKRCAFYRATVLKDHGGGEEDHELVWLPREEEIPDFRHESHRWAVDRFSGRSPIDSERNEG